MSGSLNIQAARVDPNLLDLPWRLPLDEWPDEIIAALPKGISRHLVRFAHLSGHVVAVKETTDEMARGEYEMLMTLQRLDIPCVEPIACITNRLSRTGEPLKSVLVTKHLTFSLPYRALFSGRMRKKTANRLVDSLTLLLVRLHNIGFFWGDVSLSNTLFRRDAGAFAAYLVDAETGKLVARSLSDGQREHDLEIARINIAGELLDLQASGRLDESIDPVKIAKRLQETYTSLWTELTQSESFASDETWRIRERVRRLNKLGFDIEEMSITTDSAGTTVHIQPKVVDSGHHQRRLIRLTGLDAQENQARRLLNDLDEYVARHSTSGLPEDMLAHQWLTDVFEPVIMAIPRDMRRKLQPAEIFHQLLEHRWFESEKAGRDIPLTEAVESYIRDVLAHHRDEARLYNPPTGTYTVPVEIVSAKKASAAAKKALKETRVTSHSGVTTGSTAAVSPTTEPTTAPTTPPVEDASGRFVDPLTPAINDEEHEPVPFGEDPDDAIDWRDLV
ncbi:DUF4032 domain-containing protein [Klugiella xanthotipulae]|uniref:Uncharacterized protein DUF4032 n=1 Tax=Klugiella xanthotipulae TaxID=244735 RepID=A0A543I516_9MICO|nr:DUF4032 domain-containing protein [Klugiella xanthotipulae]TQM65651.1 uncharacterized protein DUF4032 [Klugiella xanthotipulae]